MGMSLPCNARRSKGGRYRGEDGDPALRKALEIVLTDPTADIAKVMHTAAVNAQTALDARFK